jgi:hypothetical protein
LIEQPDAVQTGPKKEDEDRAKPEKDPPLHGADLPEFRKQTSLGKPLKPDRKVSELNARLKNLRTISKRFILIFNRTTVL